MEAQDFLFPEHPSGVDFTPSRAKRSPHFMNVPALRLCNGDGGRAQVEREQVRVKRFSFPSRRQIQSGLRRCDCGEPGKRILIKLMFGPDESNFWRIARLPILEMISDRCPIDV